MISYTDPTYNEMLKEFKSNGLNNLRNRAITFSNPLDRVLYYDLENPFSRMANALYVISGCSETDFIFNYDDSAKKYEYQLNAPLGERIRSYNKNDYLNYICNPIDQLIDAYEKLNNGYIAVIQLYNPTFDNFSFAYSDAKGMAPKDLTLSLEVNNEHLNATLLSSEAKLLDVFSNTIEVYSTIMRLLSYWLNLKVGTFTHIILNLYTDSLDLIKEYKHIQSNGLEVETSIDDFQEFIFIFFNNIVDSLHDDNFIMSEKSLGLLEVLKTIPDAYFRNIAICLYAYRTFKLGEFEKMYEAIKNLESTLKVECMHYLYNHCKSDNTFKELCDEYLCNEDELRYIKHKIQRSF